MPNFLIFIEEFIPSNCFRVIPERCLQITRNQPVMSAAERMHPCVTVFSFSFSSVLMPVALIVPFYCCVLESSGIILFVHFNMFFMQHFLVPLQWTVRTSLLKTHSITLVLEHQFSAVALKVKNISQNTTIFFSSFNVKNAIQVRKYCHYCNMSASL